MLLPAISTRLGGVPGRGVRAGGEHKRRRRGRRASFSKQNIDGNRRPGISLDGTRCRYLFVLLVVGLLGPRGGVLAQQYEDGGEVLMECSNSDDNRCSCSGSSEGGVSIKVFDYPTTGERVSSRVAAKVLLSYHAVLL